MRNAGDDGRLSSVSNRFMSFFICGLQTLRFVGTAGWSCDPSPCHGIGQRSVLLPVGEMSSVGPWLQRTLQNARPRAHPHKRKAPSVQRVLQELLPCREPQDSPAFSFRREAVYLPGGGLQQSLFKFIGSFQAHTNSFDRQTIRLQISIVQ